MSDEMTRFYEALNRQSFRKSIHKIWQAIKNDRLDSLDQSERHLAQILMSHQNYQAHFENEEILDGRHCATAEGVNPFLHISLHLMAEDQLRSENPIEAALLCESLEMKGCTRHEAIHAVIMVLMHEIFESSRSQEPFNPEHYRQILAKCRKCQPSEIQSILEQA